MTTPDPIPFPWLDPAAVRRQVKVPDGRAEDVEAARVAAADYVERNRRDLYRPSSDDPLVREFRPGPAVVMGAILLAARLFARSGAVLGVATYGEFATSIVRSDPDIGLMLGIGRNAKPAVG